MSGGFFDYNQHHISSIVEDLRVVVETNKYDLPTDIMEDCKNTIKVLEEAYHRVHCIDYLLSGDYGEQSYRDALKERLEKIRE